MNTERDLPLESRRFAEAMRLFCDDILLVSIWEDRYQTIVSKRLGGDGAEGGSYSAMAAQFVDEFIEPEYQASISFDLSAEYICSHLSEKNPRYHVDFRYVEDGTPTYCRVHILLVDVGAEGMAEHVLFALQDITSRAKEENLEEMAYSLMCRSYALIAFVDLNRDIMMVLHAGPNEPGAKSGVTPYREALQKLVSDTVMPEYQDEVSAILAPKHLRDLLDNGVPGATFSFERQLGGKRSWIRSQIVPFNDYSPDNARVMCYLQDISSEQARTEAYLDTVLQDNASLSQALSSEKQYRLALMADSYFYYTFDVSGDGLIKEAFRSKDGTDIIRETTGMDYPVPFELFCKKWYELYQPAFARETREDVFTLGYLRGAFLRNERIIDVEVQQTPPKGSAVPEFIEMYIVLSEDDLTGHIMACVIWKDISEFRGMELQARIALKEAYQVAEQASRAKSEFLSRMSHDIRTPMNAIIGMTAIARTRLDSPDRVEDCLRKINVSSRHLLSLINEVLDMSKIESGKVDLNEEPFDLSDLVDELTLMVRPQITAKHHQLHIQINNVRHERVIGDSLRIQQSFVNLMSNAVKYTPENGHIDLIITEKPCRQPKFGCYEFIFQDNGIGMSPEFVEHIFEPFSRAEDTRVNKIQGTGLGMAIANNLVRMMNGSIKVESKLGLGSKFTVTIFLRLQEMEEDEDWERLRGLRVLMVDSNALTCAAACDVLLEMGLRSEYAFTTREALEKVTKRGKDGYFAVILDWEMPGDGALEFIRELRRRLGEQAPPVIISAYDCSDIERDARAAGAGGFINKPLFKSRFVGLFQGMLNDEGKDAGPALDADEETYQGKRVLLVEDNELNAEIASEILSMAGLTIEHAENGRRAVEMFEASQPGWYNLIFMDVQMPIMNGYEATKAIRALDREDAGSVPIVAMTANAFTEDVEAALRSGMNAHIAKPLDFGQLSKLLSHYLA